LGITFQFLFWLQKPATDVTTTELAIRAFVTSWRIGVKPTALFRSYLQQVNCVRHESPPRPFEKQAGNDIGQKHTGENPPQRSSGGVRNKHRAYGNQSHYNGNQNGDQNCEPNLFGDSQTSSSITHSYRNLTGYFLLFSRRRSDNSGNAYTTHDRRIGNATGDTDGKGSLLD
jgi:hypothetical protein